MLDPFEFLYEAKYEILTLAMSVIVLELSINCLWSILTFLSLECKKIWILVILFLSVMALRKLTDNANTFTDSKIVYCFLLHMSNFKHNHLEPRANPKNNWTKKMKLWDNRNCSMSFFWNSYFIRLFKVVKGHSKLTFEILTIRLFIQL